ncbi:MAG: guanylate kinase [Candidatus Omnitrophica bacterium]|nr:guanylate kinase [Candidatus Omnitrophota bacterium]
MSISKSNGKIIILSGPSGSGKTTLYKDLLNKNKSLVKSISVTTRPKRPGEVHKKDYIFVSRKMFMYKIKAGHFLEYEKFFGNYYGTLSKTVRDLRSSGKNVLLCIDVKGAKNVVKKYPAAIKIFIMTLTIEDLKKRLIMRGSEDLKTIEKRLKRVKNELKEVDNYNYVIVNDNLVQAQNKLNSIINAHTGS